MNINMFIGKFVELKRLLFLGRVVSANAKKDRIICANDVVYIKDAESNNIRTCFSIIDKDLKEDVIEFNTSMISDDSLLNTFKIID